MTVALAGVGMWLGLAAMVVGLLGPLIVRNPAYRRTFAILIAVGGVVMVVAIALIVAAMGFTDQL